MVFKGDQKEGQSILAAAENRMKAWLLPRVPRCVETYHLTATTIVWSLLILLFSFLAQYDMRWMWLTSVMIALQYLTDLLDGAVGRDRDTGLVKWGYYMDHFLDYLFLCSILIGYSFLVEDHYKYMLFFILALFGAFMVNSFLSFAATNEFRISYLGIGPTEIRIVFILVNAVLILLEDKSRVVMVLPYVLGFSAFGLFVTVFRTQQVLWKIDMVAKHGPESEAVMEGYEWALRVSKRRVALGVFLSLALALTAFVILMMRPLPFHRWVALGLYGVSWVPLAWALRHTRSVLREHRKRIKGIVRPYLPYVCVAILLIICGRTAWVLMPVESSGLSRLSGRNLQEEIDKDLGSLRSVRAAADALLLSAAEPALFSVRVTDLTTEQRGQVRSFWREFTTVVMELEILKSRYRGFNVIDFNAEGEAHSTAFLVAYGSLVSQFKTSLRLIQLVGANVFMETLLDEEDAVRGIPAGSYSAIKRRLTHPEEILRLNAGAIYLGLVKKHVTGRAMQQDIERDLKAVYAVMGSESGRLIEQPLEMFEKAAFKAWFPLQKNVALRMSLIRATERENFVTREQLATCRDRLAPGDLILERRNWYMSNVGIPGFWPHVALHVGSPEGLNRFFSSEDVPGGVSAVDYLEKVYPEATRNYLGRDEHGDKRCILEALRPGCIFNSLEKSAAADYVAVLRPRVSRGDKFKALVRAFSQYGKPYDYNFDFATDNALVCSELVYKSYQDAEGLTLEPGLMSGRLILTPNMIARKFDREFGTPEQELDLVLFLDGNEAQGKALESDAEAFRKSWDRPKWSALQD